ncbi:VanZ family protein [Marseilla massiliensis]|jgi:VanZ family protein|uniref:VanZ-like domain-containing protein n=1 Tax=Marseilla massiliensis TaxID=1841864 RepID=A0A939B3P1_9BACT|nr:hypothetical protein [Marseilla massiliensis]MBM6662213.1 hypothetical protein [Marseilla massiliensis]MCL1610680.1 hypothetical protein [Marseilla massiliensis]MEE0363077.1 hypothetical protein [Prevotella sp.]
MQQTYRLIRKYPLTTACVAAIWYLSFFTPPHTELDNVRFIDKWVHVAMYGGTCLILWAEYLLRNKHKTITPRVAAAGWVAPVAMSGAIELLQAYCTGGRRSGDLADLVANAIGVSLALGAALLLARRRSSR